MKGRLRWLRILLLVIVGVVLLVTIALAVVLKSGILENLVDKVLAENVYADVSHGKIDVSLLKDFPRTTLSIDSLRVTYPHDKFAEFNLAGNANHLLDAGRGEQADTLALLDNISATVNVWKIFSGRIRLAKASLDGLSIFAHSYNDTTANWNVFPSSDEPKDSAGVSLPWISVGGIDISKLRLALTAQQGNLYAGLSADRLSAGADVKIDRCIKVHGASAELVCGMGEYNGIKVPAEFALKGKMENHDEELFLKIKDFKGNLAHIPLEAEGEGRIWQDSCYVDGSVLMEDCPLGKVLADYGVLLGGIQRQVRTDAHATLKAKAKGVISETSTPEVSALLSIPECNVYYKPLALPGRLALDASAEMDSRSLAKAVINELTAKAPGVHLEMGGKGDDLLGKDPAFKASAVGSACLDSVSRFLPKDAGIRLGGDIALDLRADASLSEITGLRFDKAGINGNVKGDRISFAMPADSLLASLFRTRIVLASTHNGIDADIDADSVYFSSGADMVVKARGMQNCAVLHKVESRGKMATRLDFSNKEKNLYLQTGDTRVLVSGAEVSAAAEKRVRDRAGRQRHPQDSLRGRRLAMPEDELSSGDIDISLDSTLTAYLRKWKTSGSVKIGKSVIATPAMPLRTRVSGFSGTFDGKDLTLDTVSVTCGTSDLAASGKVNGIGRALTRKGDIGLNLDVNSKRLNLNEIVAALQVGQHAVQTNDGGYSIDESFVTDTLADAVPDTLSSLIIVPGNVDAQLRLNVDQVDYMVLSAHPFKATARMKDRTLQLQDTRLETDLGRLTLDAFYKTASRSDIQAGLNMKMEEVSAEGIIHLIPTVDELMPALKSFKGELGCEISATTQLDENMNVLIPTLDGLIRINGENLFVEDAGELRKLTRLLLFKNANIGEIDNLYVDAVVHDSKVEVFPFELGVDRYKLALRGSQGLDKSINYHATILKSPFLVRFGINMFGTLDNWRFNLTLPKYRDGNVPQFTQELDAMQVNIRQSIRDIYKKGKKNVEEYNKDIFKSIDDKKYAIGYDDTKLDRELTTEEYMQIDSLAFEYEALEWEAELMEEMDAVLEESYTEMEKLMKEYAEMTYDKSVERQLERMKKQEEKKKEREAAREAKKNK